MQLITEAWETSQNIASFRTRENDLHRHLQMNLRNEERFYQQTMIPFANHAINKLDLKRRQEELPLPKVDQTIKSMLERES
jgi:hypothetical protein